MAWLSYSPSGYFEWPAKPETVGGSGPPFPEWWVEGEQEEGRGVQPGILALKWCFV